MDLKVNKLNMKRAIYRHYKGQYYIVYLRSKHTETGEDVVVYRNIRDDVFATNGYHSRPAAMFFGSISEHQQRFVFISDVPSDKGQTKKETIIETSLSVVIGFALSWGAWYWIIPLLFDSMEQSASDATGITLFFTVLSLVRSYYWRRFSNWIMHRDA